MLVWFSFTFSAIGYSPQFADEAKTVPLRWKNNTIPIAISSSLFKQNLNIRPDSDVLGAIRRSLETWESVANIKFVEVPTDKLSVSPSGKSGDGISLITIAQTSENLVLFGNEATEVSARTRVFFNNKGYITEADIVLNPYQQFSTDGSVGTFDLEATLTHEVGHLLGLEHSSVLGATMQTSQGRNGVYNLPGFSARTLAEDDIAGVRSLYGPGKDAENCCGTVSGSLSLPDENPAEGFDVWLEEIEERRVIAGVQTDPQGRFRIGGLPSGEYIVYAKDPGRENSQETFSAQEIGEIEIGKGRKTEFSATLENYFKNFQLQYIGFNGQLSELAVPVNAGKSYVIYLGGKNLEGDDFQIGFYSPYINVNPKSIVKHDYGRGISVISCEIKLSPATPLGEYSFFVKKKRNDSDISFGSVTVENYLNPWSSFLNNPND